MGRDSLLDTWMAASLRQIASPFHETFDCLYVLWDSMVLWASPPDLWQNVDEPRLVYITSVAMNLWRQEPHCLRGSIAILKHHDQKANWGRKVLFGLYFHVVEHHWRMSGGQIRQGWTWRQEVIQTPWKDAVYWLASQSLLSLLLYRT